MKRKRYTDEQIAFALCPAENDPLAADAGTSFDVLSCSRALQRLRLLPDCALVAAGTYACRAIESFGEVSLSREATDHGYLGERGVGVGQQVLCPVETSFAEIGVGRTPNGQMKCSDKVEKAKAGDLREIIYFNVARQVDLDIL
jgi:hypothetical protein